jgi:hypothetical protein
LITDTIAQDIGLRAEYIAKVVRTANHRYKTYHVPKRSGGQRKIEHPARELKLLQRWVTDNVLMHLPIDEAVFSYRKNRSIRDLAERHVHTNYLLRIDFQDFFPSICDKDIDLLLTSCKCDLPYSLSEPDIDTICRLVCKRKQLVIGAPSSPSISNSILHDFDKTWRRRSVEKGVVYTRYADDLYFSTNHRNILEPLYKDLKLYIKGMASPRLTVNESKTVFTSRKHLRMVTGLVLTSTHEVSLGRNQKRYIRSLIYRYLQGRLDSEYVSYLGGYLAYASSSEPSSSEPSFVDRLRRKFGAQVIDELFITRRIRRK